MEVNRKIPVLNEMFFYKKNRRLVPLEQTYVSLKSENTHIVGNGASWVGGYAQTITKANTSRKKNDLLPGILSPS